MSGILAPASPFESLAHARSKKYADPAGVIDYNRRALAGVRAALREAKTPADAIAVADRTSALAEYARRAKNRDLEIDSLELRWRAERRLGQLLADIVKPGRWTKGHRLADFGIAPPLSALCRHIAELGERDFEGVIEKFRESADRIRVLPRRFPSPSVVRARAYSRKENRRLTIARLLANAQRADRGPVQVIDAVCQLLIGDPLLLRRLISDYRVWAGR